MLSSFIIAIGGAIAIKTNELLAARLPIWLSVLIAAALLATFVFGTNTAFGWLRGDFAAFRRLVDARAQFEGKKGIRTERDKARLVEAHYTG